MEEQGSKTLISSRLHGLFQDRSERHAFVNTVTNLQLV